MATAPKDPNFVNAKTAVLNTDGATVVKLTADPTTHALGTNDGTTGTDYGPKNAIKDGNDVATWLGTSSADGKTPVTLYADSNGKLLIQSS